MSGDQFDPQKVVNLLGKFNFSLKSVIGGIGLTLGLTLFYFYGLNIVTYPWAYKLTAQTPQGNWIGKISLDQKTTFLVNITMAHDTVLSDTKSNRAPEIQGLISICSPQTELTEAKVYGDPSWTGSTVVLGTKIDFGGKITPEKLICKAKSNSLECIFDFEHPISNASKKFREDFKKIYTPKAEFIAKINVPFEPMLTNSKSFADQCKNKKNH
jgi:hypothetical protein